MALWATQRGYHKAAIVFQAAQPDPLIGGILASSFKRLGGQITTSEYLAAGAASYGSEVARVISSHPQVVFFDGSSGEATVAMSDFRELNQLSIPFIATDVAGGSDWVKAVSPFLSKANVSYVMPGSETGAAATAFNAAYASVIGGAPVSNANLLYDALNIAGLAIDKARSTSSSAIVKAIPENAGPTGTLVSTYAAGLSDIKAGKKINLEGASGPLEFDKYHNVFGPWDLFRLSASGAAVAAGTLTAAQLLQATSG
jgi:branched-chain amino acid transport system substrate-binding protein